MKLNTPALTNLIQRSLPLQDWNFTESVKTDLTIIYNSQWCRVKFVWQGWDMYTGNSISIYYGRLHAPNDKWVMTLHDMECYCWHDIKGALNFLDGLSPQQAVDQLYLGKWPNVAEQFKESELGKSLEHNQPEWLISMHAAIWEHYSLRLFKLFDLRYTDIWEQYIRFIEEYHMIAKSPKLSGYPPQDQIC